MEALYLRERVVTLREILNGILDYPIQFDLWNYWEFWAGAVMALFLIFLIAFIVSKFDGDNGWWI